MGTGGRIAALAVLVALCAMLLPAAASAASTGLKGQVTDSSTNEPIPGAEVCAISNGGGSKKVCESTDSSGKYKIEGLEPEEYRVEFNAPQHERKTSTVTVKSGELSEVNAELEETGQGAVTGQVTNASNGQGAGGVEVCISASEANRCTETNGNGEYVISGISVGSYTIAFFSAQACEEEQGEKVRCQPKSNLLSQSVSVKVKANKTETANVALQSGGQISGTVTSASITHPGIAKIEVCATKMINAEDEYGPGGCAFTNTGGQYTIDGLESGAYKLEFNGYICSIPKKGERECPEIYVTQYSHGKQTHKLAETVPVTIGANTSGVNESLREAFPAIPVSIAAPTLTGTPVAGQALTCSQGSWSHEPTYVVYQWLRNGTVITGQTGATYTLQTADQAHSITCSVTAGNGAGAAVVMSNAVSIPVPLALFAGVKVKGAVALVKLRCPGPGACSGVMKLVARVVTRHGSGKKTSKVTIGVASFSMAAGKSITLRVHLTGRGRKLLGQGGKKGLKVQIAGTGLTAKAAVLKEAATKHRR